MGEKDETLGFGLDLSLSLEAKDQQNQASFKLNLMPFPSLFTHNIHHTISCNDIFSSSGGNSDAGLSRRGIDVNRVPLVADRDDETGISSPNSTISSLSGKRSDKEQIGGEETEEAEKASLSLCGSDDEDGGDASRKKLRLSKEQSLLLEETFKEHNTLNPKQKLALAKQLNLRPRQVEVWFQNRRAR